MSTATPSDATEQSETDIIELEPPSLQKARFGMVGEMWATRRYLKKRQKMIKKGYVEWYLISDGFPKPRFVKPKARGGGIREVKHKGDRYLFPESAMIANEANGGWTIAHNKGDAAPINLREPDELAIPTDVLEEYIQMRPSASPPSLLSRLDLDPQDLFMYGLIAIVGFAFLQGMVF